jgi:hypothetical protein
MPDAGAALEPAGTPAEGSSYSRDRLLLRSRRLWAD